MVSPLKEKIKNGKVPNIGWYKLSNISEDSLVSSNLNAEYYFVHSYYVAPEDESVVAAYTEYGCRFASIVARDNVFAAQFHPEKSKKTGSNSWKSYFYMLLCLA